MVGLPALFVPHSSSLSPAMATGVLSAPLPISAPPTSLDECLFFISLVSDFLAVRFSVSSGCARRRSVPTYAAILVLLFFISVSVSFISDLLFFQAVRSSLSSLSILITSVLNSASDRLLISISLALFLEF